MAVIIDMNIPKYCKQCPMCMEVRDTFAYCMLLGYQLKITELDLKDGYCPLKEVKECEAEDCISRQAVEKITWEEPTYTDALNVLTEVRDKVRELPSVLPKADNSVLEEIKNEIIEHHEIGCDINCKKCKMVACIESKDVIADLEIINKHISRK